MILCCKCVNFYFRENLYTIEQSKRFEINAFKSNKYINLEFVFYKILHKINEIACYVLHKKFSTNFHNISFKLIFLEIFRESLINLCISLTPH